MRTISTLSFGLFALLAASSPAMAFLGPETNTAWPTQHQREARYGADVVTQPNAMNYSDEAALRLGIRNGNWEAFDTHSSDPLMPSLRGGIDKGKPAISLQWRPGQ
jgi:hypothetical protein